MLTQDAAADFDLLDLHAYNPQRYPFLLQSPVDGPLAHYDILFGFPGEQLSLCADGRLQGAPNESGTDFLQALDTLWRAGANVATDMPRNPNLPFRGGWFVYLGYELAAQIEPKLSLPRALEPLPVARATRIPAALIRDRVQRRVLLVAEPGRDALLAQMHADIGAMQPSTRAVTSIPIRDLREAPGQDYLRQVRTIKDYVREGDVFQVNLSRAWEARVEPGLGHAELYRTLRERNPGPFNALACWPEGAVISSSPERLVSVRDGVAETRPIAGTRPRGSGADEDLALSDELLAHPKERAEHVMLVDLERNDLGRISVPGSVRVDELMVLETYAHVHHIVSNIRGRLREGITPGQVIRALFPGGTITGCPKVRCMEIIAELEQVGRGAYTGSMGYLNHDGDLDLNILIRSFVRYGDRLSLRAGAGIVAGSVPEAELAETRAKARGLLLALDEHASMDGD